MKNNKNNKNIVNKNKIKKNRNNNKKIKMRKFNPINPNNIIYKNPVPIHKEYIIKTLNYIKGVIEPEICVSDGFIAKQPSIFNLPSTSVGFRNNINISTDVNGDFYLAWNPNFLANESSLQYYVFVNNGVDIPCNTFSHLCSKDIANNSLNFYPSYVPKVDLSKYRLVSAKIKVTYIGSNLEKSGMLYACATYDQMPVLVGLINNSNVLPYKKTNGSWIDPVTDLTFNGNSFAAKNAYESMTEQRISNGIWNKNVNVVQSNQGISCLHIPTDPISEIFYPLGTYFGERTPYKNINTTDVTAASNQIFPYNFSTAGSQLCYLVCGHGLPANKEVINIQTFYNYEVIPTVSSAPFLKGNTDNQNYDYRVIESARQVIRNVAPQVAIRTGKGNVIDEVKKFYNSLANNKYVRTAGDIAKVLIPFVTKYF